MTIKKVIEILQAYDRGEVVQSYNAISKTWEDVDLKSAWDSKNIRIKPKCQEPEFVPYANAKEFRSAQRKHGLYVQSNVVNQDHSIRMTLPVEISDDGIMTVLGAEDEPFEEFTYQEVLECLKWEDGTRCGKLK